MDLGFKIDTRNKWIFMKSQFYSIIFIGAFIGLGFAHANETKLSIRWVEASNTVQDNDHKLADVMAILTAQLPFTSYKLVDYKLIPLPAEYSTSLARGYQLKCHGQQSRLAVEVRHQNVDLLKTTVSLKDNKPLILGGFPTEDGKLILILVAD